MSNNFLGGMFLGVQLSHGARLIAVIVSLLPLYLTLASIKDAPFLTDLGREMVYHPISIILIAYGTAYAAIGDAGATIKSMSLLLGVLSYIFVLQPHIAYEYFDMQYLKDYIFPKKK